MNQRERTTKKLLTYLSKFEGYRKKSEAEKQHIKDTVPLTFTEIKDLLQQLHTGTTVKEVNQALSQKIKQHKAARYEQHNAQIKQYTAPFTYQKQQVQVTRITLDHNLKINELLEFTKQYMKDDSKIYNINMFIEGAPGLRWHMGSTSFKNKKDLDINTFDESSLYYVDDTVTVSKVEVYSTTPGKAKGGRSDKNDCLYNCLLASYNFNTDKLKPFETPALLKSKLGLTRLEMVPVDKLEIIEQKLNCSFEIPQVDYISKVIIPHNHIRLNLVNEHFTLNFDHLPSISAPIHKSKHMIYTYYKDDKHVTIYNNMGARVVDLFEFFNMKKKSNMFHFIKVKSNNDLMLEYDAFIKHADEISSLTHNKIDRYRYNKASDACINLFHLKTSHVIQPEPASPLEQQILNKALHGGLYYSATDGNYNGSYIDMNSMYPYYLTSNLFTISTGIGQFKELTRAEFNQLKFYSYGLYLVKQLSTHPLIKNRAAYQWVTHYDLQLFQLVGVKFELFEGETNTILYPERMNGQKVFNNYFDFLNTIENKKAAKIYKNTLWGALSEKNYCKIQTSSRAKDPVDISGMYVKYINTNVESKDNITIINYIDKAHVFKYPSWCRVGVFLTACARFNMMRIILKHFTLDNIYSIRTDGLVVNAVTDSFKPLIGADIGQFKIVNSGKFTLKSGIVTFQ